MAADQESEQNRLKAFANLFKGYMGVMPMVTAALAPLVTMMSLIPAYEAQRKCLATMTGVLGFLVLAWLFYFRRTIALGSITKGFRWIINLVPLFLIFGCIFCYVCYSSALDASLAEVSKSDHAPTRSEALKNWGKDNVIPKSMELQLFYLGIFLCAEASFVMMALREYANGIRNVSEVVWMFGPQDNSRLPVIDDSGKEVET
jgi:hypothetical protein